MYSVAILGLWLFCVAATPVVLSLLTFKVTTLGALSIVLTPALPYLGVGIGFVLVAAIVYGYKAREKRLSFALFQEDCDPYEEESRQKSSRSLGGWQEPSVIDEKQVEDNVEAHPHFEITAYPGALWVLGNYIDENRYRCNGYVSCEKNKSHIHVDSPDQKSNGNGWELIELFQQRDAPSSTKYCVVYNNAMRQYVTNEPTSSGGLAGLTLERIKSKFPPDTTYQEALKEGEYIFLPGSFPQNNNQSSSGFSFGGS